MTYKPITRPLISLYWPELAALKDERHNDLAGLIEILIELRFRSSPGAVRTRELVTERLYELIEEGFPWPTTTALTADGYLEVDNWPRKGMLSHLGYHVGKSGLYKNNRRKVLDFAYTGKLPNLNDKSYMDKWAKPRTSARLRQIGESIAAFCRNLKRKDPNALAVQEWEADLEYLRTEYYVGHYDFTWPSTTLI